MPQCAALLSLVDFLPVNRDLSWSFDSDANAARMDAHNGHDDRITDMDRFTVSPRQNKQGHLP